MSILVLPMIAIQVFTPGRAAGQENVLGVWEIVDDAAVTVMSFRDDGIMVQNEYYAGELQCVFVFPFDVDGDQLTIGQGLTWEVDAETGVLVPNEDPDELLVEFRATVTFSGDQLVLVLGNEYFAAQTLAFVEETLELDPADDLGLSLDGGEVSEEELATLFQKVISVALAQLFGVPPELLPASENINIAELIVALANAQLLSFLAEFLEIDLLSINFDLSGELDIVSLLLTLDESLDLDSAALATLDAEIQVEFFDLDDVADLSTIRCVRSERSVLGPTGEILLPNGRTAIRQLCWGQVKRQAQSGHNFR